MRNASKVDSDKLLGQARFYLSKHPVRQVSENTLAQYFRDFARITKSGSIRLVIEALCDTRRVSTYYKRKYALLAILSLRIDSLMTTLEAPVEGILSPEQLVWLDGWLRLAKAISALGNKCPIPTERRLPRRSKRRALSGLPADWREKLIDKMANSKHHLAALVAAVSGCRPVEMVAGISVEIDGNVMRLTINGAKLGVHSGQPVRVIEYVLPAEQCLVSNLAGLILKAGGYRMMSIDNANAFSASVSYYGRRAFPGRQQAITPYCFRHAFASDLKRYHRGFGDALSQALGHRADRTRSCYGQAQIAKAGGLVPSSVRATHAVRHAIVDPVFRTVI
ncbi:hypothetical protein SAMN02949497_1711 [Methylomagnum ishizawai]|uniref:Phage integrase family protein n=1 Tax=Methylomagnum ishizawai TaxID=1760988 RepID=A0A1Y6CVT2_9GAMM|nr:site-specific integrase [Methylomagnum ishizawai]SMF94396.1 hypothetical protein SAMN02949497_1711 [Methylomagnum ishizawai]